MRRVVFLRPLKVLKLEVELVIVVTLILAPEDGVVDSRGVVVGRDMED